VNESESSQYFLCEAVRGPVLLKYLRKQFLSSDIQLPREHYVEKQFPQTVPG